MAFVKARVVAGAAELGDAFLNRLSPWVFQRFMSAGDLADVRALRHKLERRAESSSQLSNVLSDAGGREDIELAILFLQLLHGGDLASVRNANTASSIESVATNRMLDPSRIFVTCGQLRASVSTSASVVADVWPAHRSVACG